MIPPTRNDAWGFFGTTQMAGADPMEAWNAASAMIAAETDASPEGVRDFLDSRLGRHFVDEVAGSLAADQGLGVAMEAAIAGGQSWRIDRRNSRDQGVPVELSYLTGWVAHFQILDEMQA